MWVEPYATGTYLGNCAEYCGVQHAKSRRVAGGIRELDRVAKGAGDGRSGRPDRP